MKRIAVIADTHCGHQAGLVPPEWQSGRYAPLQRRLWAWYEGVAQAIGHVDALVLNGDAIDGRGEKSGGIELVSGDRQVQVDMAAQAMDVWDAGRRIVIGGTPYHTGAYEQWDRLVAKEAGGEYYSALEMDVDGMIVEFRHHVGGSGIPHGRATAALRELLWKDLEALRRGRPAPAVIVRSHVHYFLAVETRDGHAFVTPGLQVTSRFGQRVSCVGSDVGLLVLNIGDGAVQYELYLCDEVDSAPPTVTL